MSQERMDSTGWFVARLIASAPWWYLGNALCWILFHTWALLPGLLTRAFFDSLTGSASAGLNLPTLAALALAAGAGRALVILCAQWTGVPFNFQTQSLLWRNLLARILERPGARAVPGTVGEALSTLRDDVGAMSDVLGWAFDAVAAAFYAVGAVAVLLRVDARVTLLAFLPIVAVIVVAQAVRARLVGVREQSRAATARVTGAIGEIFGGVQAIQVAGAEGRAVAWLGRLSEERQKAMLADRLQGLWLDGIFEQTASAGAGLVLLVAAGQMRPGQFTVGDFALFASYLMQVSAFTSFLGYLISTYRQAGVPFRRMMELMQGAPPGALVARDPAPIGGQGAAVTERLERLDVVGLTCRHPGSGRGVEGISFTLERGSFMVITGRVGAGKSTLLRTLLGLLEMQAGEIHWNGQRVAQPGSFFVPPRAAYTAQVPTLLSGTVRENILLDYPVGPGAVERAVRAAVLEEDVAAFPAGLETLIGVRGLRLSGGQVQRTAAARMFVREAELLVCDDLSSALDAGTEQQLWQRLAERGATCLVVSHRPAVLARADQVLVLEEGQLCRYTSRPMRFSG